MYTQALKPKKPLNTEMTEASSIANLFDLAGLRFSSMRGKQAVHFWRRGLFASTQSLIAGATCGDSAPPPCAAKARHEPLLATLTGDPIGSAQLHNMSGTADTLMHESYSDILASHPQAMRRGEVVVFKPNPKWLNLKGTPYLEAPGR